MDVWFVRRGAGLIMKLYEYSAAATPTIPALQYVVLPPLVSSVSERVLWNLQGLLQTEYPATTPALAGYHLHLVPGSPLETQDVTTSTLVRFQTGTGVLRIESLEEGAREASRDCVYGPGDVVVIPGLSRILWKAESVTSGFVVTDEPLLRYLGVTPVKQTIELVKYSRDAIAAAIAGFRAQPGASTRNRCGVIFGQEATSATMTASRTLWSLFNILPANTVQKPHRHQSVAVDVAVEGRDGVYTLMSPRITAEGQLIDPIRADWVSGAAFITPPGWWHSHHNETGEDATVFPVQDAGLHTYLRTLDIQFIR